MVVARTFFPNQNVWLSVFIVNLMATAVMCVLSWSSPALPMITHPGGAKILVTEGQGTILSSIAALGASFGPFVTGRLADSCGRKTTLLGGMLLLLATWAILYFCTIFAVLVGARFLAGTCVGCVYGILPMYVAEISPVNLRGPLNASVHVFDSVAFIIMSTAGGYLSYENLTVTAASIPFVAFVLFAWIPESPYYLQNCGREVEALHALRFFRDNADIMQLKNEIEEMKTASGRGIDMQCEYVEMPYKLAAKNVKENRVSVWSLFTTRGNLKCVYYAAALIFFQISTGIPVMIFYSKTVFIKSESKISPDASAVILYVVMAIFSLVVIGASKVFKTRTLLMFSSFGVIVSMALLAGFFYIKERYVEISHSLDWLPLTALVLYMATYTLGWGPIIWCITAVIFPASLKASACSLCASFVYMLAFLYTSTFLSLDPTIGFTVFGGLMVVSCFFVYFHLPEIKGKTFQEIQDTIQGSKDQFSANENHSTHF